MSVCIEGKTPVFSIEKPGFCPQCELSQCPCPTYVTYAVVYTNLLVAKCNSITAFVLLSDRGSLRGPHQAFLVKCEFK